MAVAGNVGTPPGSTIVGILKDTYGTDISEWKRKQLNEKMLADADKIIVLMREKERREYLPKYFKKFSGKTAFWNVIDMRHTKSIDARRKRIAKIRDLVKELVQELESSEQKDKKHKKKHGLWLASARR